ncbi:MAG: proprotein convertase P-domain-containing protein [Chthonomonadaceae bacterium]|nr:proprotein convertase P-domain-containing protein [Chthonomonadaceae bacterium]
MSQANHPRRGVSRRNLTRFAFIGSASALALGAIAYETNVTQKALELSALKRGATQTIKGVPISMKKGYDSTPKLTQSTQTFVEGMTAETDQNNRLRRLQGSVMIRKSKGNSNARSRTNAKTTQSDTDLFLQQNAAALGLSQNLGELKVTREVDSLTRHHVTYAQVYEGVPVYHGELSVHSSKSGAIELVNLDLVPITNPVPLSTNLSGETAITNALQAVGPRTVSTQTPTAEPFVYVIEGTPISVWRVRFDTYSPSAAWDILVNASTGAILRKVNTACYVDGTGKVYNPDPVTTSGDSTLTDNDNADSPVLNAQRQTVTLKGLDGSGFLTGTYATTTVPSTESRAFSSTFNYDFNRSQSGFDETMGYYHIDLIERYIQSLGFTNINNRRVIININSFTDDNAFYSPGTKQISMGSGGVNDVQDASVTWHESGHAIQDNQVPGWGSTEEGGSMGEGWGDYWAVSQFAGVGPKAPGWDIYLGKWDATSYNPGDPAFLRTVVSSKHYPEDVQGEVHADGEMWSASLWQIRGIVGRTRADKMILESHFSVPASSAFSDGANAILAANQTLYADADRAAIRKVLIDRGFIFYANAPTNVAATAVSPTRINLSWTDNNNNETGYKIERKTENGLFTQIAVTGANANSYVDTVSADTTYVYRLRATTIEGDSPFSSSVVVTTPALKFSLSGGVRGVTGLGGISLSATGTGVLRTFNSVSPNLPIPDNNTTGVTSTLSLAGTGTVTAVHLSLNLTHTFIGDLEISLIAPDNTTVIVHNRTGADNQDIITVYPDQTLPANSFDAFNGKRANGTWRLKVRDLDALDVGQINFWSLSVSYNASITRTITTATDGTFALLNLPALTYVVTPTTTGLTYSPATRSLTLNADASGVNFSALSSLSGVLGLQGISNKAKSIDFQFRPTEGGSPLLFTQTLTASGNYAFTGIPAGTYTLAAKGSKWLRATTSIDLTRNLTNASGLTLLVGDINGDNSIDFGDLSQMLQVYNSISGDRLYVLADDLNEDGGIDFGDLSLLLQNYNALGAE